MAVSNSLVPHQKKHVELIDDRVATKAAARPATPLAATPATTAPSATYVQAEAAAVRSAVEQLRTVLRTAGLLAP